MRRVQSRIVVGISVLTVNVIIVELVKYYFTCSIDSLTKMPFSYRSIAITDNLGNLGQRVSSVRFQSNYVFSRVFVPFFKNYPLQTIKYTRINIRYKSWKNFERGALKDVENVILLAKNIYQTPTSHGAEKRRIPLPVRIDQIYSLYGATNTPSRIISESIPLPNSQNLSEQVVFDDLSYLFSLVESDSDNEL